MCDGVNFRNEGKPDCEAGPETLTRVWNSESCLEFMMNIGSFVRSLDEGEKESAPGAEVHMNRLPCHPDGGSNFRQRNPSPSLNDQVPRRIENFCSRSCGFSNF